MSGPPRVADLKPGDIVRLKKAHPCGGFHWLVNRVGGDIGLRCQTCEHYIMIPRFRIDRRIREIVRPTAGADGSDSVGMPGDSGTRPPGEKGNSGGPNQ